MAIGPIVRVFNHAPFPVMAVKDGRSYTLPPGFSHVTADVVRYAQNQNPVPGSEDAGTLQYESLVSLATDDRPDDQYVTIPESVLTSLPHERIDRGSLAPERQGKHVQEVRTAFPRGRVGVERPTVGMLDPGRFGGE